MKLVSLILAILFPLNSFSYDVAGYLLDYRMARIVFNVSLKKMNMLVPNLSNDEEQFIAETCAKEVLGKFTTEEILTERKTVSAVLLASCHKEWAKFGYYVSRVVISDIRAEQ